MLIQIQKYEKECLEALLGKALYDEFMMNLELDTDGYWKVKSGSDDKWGWLLSGKDNWRGLVVKVATIESKNVFETLPALYIFFQLSLNSRTLNTGTGEGKLNASGTTQESSKNKRVDAWNEFVRWADFGFGCDNLSLNQFLCSNNESYPNAKTVNLNTMTYYDI